MRLAIDLRSFAAPAEPQEGERVVHIHDLAAMVRTPIALARLLIGSRWSAVRVLSDGPPVSGVQAGALGLAALARSPRFALELPGTREQLSHAAMLRRATRSVVSAVPAELMSTLRGLRKARHVALQQVVLPRPARRPERMSYLRSEPSLRWMGLHVGGAATHTAGVINGLVANGVDVRVYAPERPDGTEGVAFTSVAPRRLLQAVHWLTLFEYTREQADAADGRSVDAVYQRYALGSYAGLELARRLDVPLVLEFNGSEIWAEQHWGGGSVPFGPTLIALERRNLMDATLVVVVSDPLREQLMEMGVPEERILVNPNGVDTERLASLRAHTPAEHRRRLGRPETPTVGFIGTFGLWHGIKVLPDLIAQVAKTHPKTRWHVVGDGPLRSEFIETIAAMGLADSVLAPGLVPHEEATQLLAACDVCVSPHVPNPDGTAFFGSPTKLFEYMGLGKAIVASDLDQIGQVLSDGETALLIEPGAAAPAAVAVARLLDDAGLRERLGAAALLEAERSYSWTAHVDRILDAVERLAAGR